MSASYAIGETIAERWIARILQSYPAKGLALLSGELDTVTKYTPT